MLLFLPLPASPTKSLVHTVDLHVTTTIIKFELYVHVGEVGWLVDGADRWVIVDISMLQNHKSGQRVSLVDLKFHEWFLSLPEWEREWKWVFIWHCIPNFSPSSVTYHTSEIRNEKHRWRQERVEVIPSEEESGEAEEGGNKGRKEGRERGWVGEERGRRGEKRGIVGEKRGRVRERDLNVHHH